jgi:mRNA interferase MazF
VVVPFPFTDSAKAERRPALILSRTPVNDTVKHSVMAMVTSQKNASWLLDVPIRDLEQAGLPAPSVVRMKLFTLDQRLIRDAIGH